MVISLGFALRQKVKPNKKQKIGGGKTLIQCQIVRASAKPKAAVHSNSN